MFCLFFSGYDFHAGQLSGSYEPVTSEMGNQGTKVGLNASALFAVGGISV